MDPVKQLIEVVLTGFCAEIAYIKAGEADPRSTRVVAPLKLVDGLNDLMVRAIQLAPQNGLRTFKVSQILDVRPSTVPLGTLSSRVALFCSGEVKPRREAALPEGPAVVEKPTPAESAQLPASQWRAEWFRVYLNALQTSLLDMRLDEAETMQLLDLQNQLKLTYSQICAVHAYWIGQEMLSISVDGQADTTEREYVDELQTLLSRLGWPIRH